MSEMRNDEAGNDVEFEVSRLDDDASGATTPSSDPAGEAPQLRNNARDGAHITSESSPRSRPRRRLLQASVTGLAVALTVAIILVSFPGSGEQLGGPLLPFAPTPTIPPGSDIILLAHTVPWGELHLERADLHPVSLGFRERYPVYRLPPGRHTLFYVATPFSPMQCTLSVPRSSDDDCKLATSRDSPTPNTASPTRLIDAGASVKWLDGGALVALQTLLATGIAHPSLTIEPGTHYLGQNGRVLVAGERLMVTMSMGVAPPPSSVTLFDDDGQPCRVMCNLDSDQDYLTWRLTIWAAPRWTYVAANGDTFTAYGPTADIQSQASVLWRDGKWTLDTQNGLGSPCDFRISTQLLSARMAAAGLDTFTQYGGNSPVVANPANGCVFEFHAQEDPGDHPRPDVLYRLGVALAANADAQRMFPDLPVASPAERDLAQAFRTGELQ